jgi:hypothetical protein
MTQTAAFEAAYIPSTGELMNAYVSLPSDLPYPKFVGITQVAGGRVWKCLQFGTDARSGSKNEAAIRRYKAIMKVLDAAGVEITFETRTRNTFKTREEFEAKLFA